VFSILAYYPLGITTYPIPKVLLGGFIGARLMKKVTLRAIQIIVGIMLIVFGVGMVVGVI
jgi:uncharacterized protein